VVCAWSTNTCRAAAKGRRLSSIEFIKASHEQRYTSANYLFRAIGAGKSVLGRERYDKADELPVFITPVQQMSATTGLPAR
jgi:hypothetical protein